MFTNSLSPDAYSLFGIGIFLLLLVFSFGFYFLPTLIGWRRKNSSLTPLFLCNLVFGWTVLGWLVVLFWALLVKKGA